jgi:hypothetical protein
MIQHHHTNDVTNRYQVDESDPTLIENTNRAADDEMVEHDYEVLCKKNPSLVALPFTLHPRRNVMKGILRA